MEDRRRRAGKGPTTEGSSKRKEAGTDPAATPAGKRLRPQKVTEVYGGEWVARHKKVFLRWLYSSGVSFNAFRNQAWKAYQQVLLEQPGSCPHVVLPNHNEIARLEVEPVCTGTRRGMKEEEIARQVALITRNPIGASAPPSADDVFGRRACIFRRYPREDDSDEEPVPEAAGDPALCIPREIDETHDDPDDEETRARIARRVSGGGPGGQGDAGGRGEVLGPIRGGRFHGRHRGAGGGGTVGSSSGRGMAPAAVADATVAAAVDEIAAAAAVLEEMLASLLEEEAPAVGGAAIVEGQVATPGGAVGGAAAVEVEGAAVEEEDAPSAAAVEGGVAGPVEEEIAAQAEVPRGGDDERLMQQFLTEELDPVIAGMTPGVARGFGISDSEMGTHLDFDLSMSLPPSCDGATSTDRAPSRDEAAGQTLTQTPRERTTTESPDAARNIMGRERARLLTSSNLRAQTFAWASEEARLRETGGDGVQDSTQRKRGVPPCPRPVPAEGGAALGESSGAEGLGMPRESRREQTVAEASARVVVLRKRGDPVTREEGDPNTDAAVWEEDEDYEGEEEGEEESKSGSDGDDDDDYDEPPPPPRPPPTCASTRFAARTSSSARGRKRSTSDTRGGTRRQSGKGKKGR
ncbi:hypothetical protein CBR_g39410 [Chara braunii]|uniref:Uncharacterized protein n=1 Tax=Chara braunii TaxID=69332 RepID=A0A388LRL1_CHABU|nr:hypothetical protein CBR_g39410 [Chara braunii]|eukprot:GBG84947.1 hypothetical protein CBR_g39410 [Chara braunii]